MLDLRTVRVRIAVAVNAEGKWSALGCNDTEDLYMRNNAIGWLPVGSPRAVHFIEADVPLPVSETIEGRVVP